MNIEHGMLNCQTMRTKLSEMSVLWRVLIHGLRLRRYSIPPCFSLQAIWMRLQAWQLPAVAVAARLNPAEEKTRMKMTASGHAVAQGWQTKCVDGQKRKVCLDNQQPIIEVT